MKIALVILHADPSRGGAERYTFDLAAALAARGHDVALVASSFGPEPTAAPHVHLPVKALTRLGYYRRFLDALDAHLDVERYDIVHAMLPVRRCDVYHPHAGLAADSIETGHQKYDGVRRSLARVTTKANRKRLHFAAVERELLESDRVPLVLSLSQYVKRTVQEHYPHLPESKLATLFNGVDVSKFDPSRSYAATPGLRERFEIPADACLALMIAQDFRRKGLGEAIRALPPDAPRLELLVVGSGGNQQHYQRLAIEAGVGLRVTFAGSQSDPREAYEAADFFVLPTRHDPCSLVVLEALAMGLPVISTAYNGATEIMTDGVHGFVLPDPRDVDALRDRYRRLLDPEARAAMSHACLALRPQLSQEHHVDKLISIYQSIKMEGPHHARPRDADP